MAEMKDIIKIAVDAYHGNVEQYSVGQSMELLQKALIEANGGSTTLNYKNIRDGKCSGLFTLIEEVLSRTVVEGLQGDEYFNALVDFRNVAEGDKNIFEVEDSTLFIVSEAADGTQGIRRQRLGGFSEVSIPTSLKVVKIYEELNRVLSGRVDFNHFINKVAESFRQKVLNDVYALLRLLPVARLLLLSAPRRQSAIWMSLLWVTKRRKTCTTWATPVSSMALLSLWLPSVIRSALPTS